MKNRDFTIDVYKELLDAIQNSDYRVLTMGAFFSRKKPDTAMILLRHDVDRRPENALHMAEIESMYNIRSTYYFRFTKSVFKPNIMRQIEKAGHEIGYHYEVLDKARGDMTKAGRLFDFELAQMRSLVDIRTVCMHGNPLSPWDNRDFWNHYTLSQFGLTGEAYLSISDANIYYTTDTGRGWNRKNCNLKDAFPGYTISYMPTFTSTRQMIVSIASGEYKRIYLQLHPNRWTGSLFQWNLQVIEDFIANMIKRVMALYRKRKNKK